MALSGGGEDCNKLCCTRSRCSQVCVQSGPNCGFQIVWLSVHVASVQLISDWLPFVSKLRLILYTVMAAFRQQTPVNIIHYYGCLSSTNSGWYYILLWLPFDNKLRYTLYTIMAAFAQQTPVDNIYCYGCLSSANSGWYYKYYYGWLSSANSGWYYTLLWLTSVGKLRFTVYTIMAAFRQQTPVYIIRCYGWLRSVNSGLYDTLLDTLWRD